MPYRLRPADPHDACHLARLSTELGYPATSEEVAGRLARIAGGATDAVFVAETPTGEVVGWVHVFVANRVESAPFAEIGGLIVGRPWQGAGAGRMLIEAAEAWAREEGLQRLRVRADTRRDQAHTFYQRAGFVRLKTQAVFSKEIGAPAPAASLPFPIPHSPFPT